MAQRLELKGGEGGGDGSGFPLRPVANYHPLSTEAGRTSCEVGLLTYRSILNGSLPISNGDSGVLTGELAVYSGGTVRDFHPLPFSLVLDDEYLVAKTIFTIATKVRQCMSLNIAFCTFQTGLGPSPKTTIGSRCL